MAKMIRCPAGHVYDKEAHDSCPECARAAVRQADQAQVSPSKAEDQQDQRRSLPLPWLAGGGVAMVALIAATIFLLRPTEPPAVPPDAADVCGIRHVGRLLHSACLAQAAGAEFSSACRSEIGSGLPGVRYILRECGDHGLRQGHRLGQVHRIGSCRFI